MAEREPNEYSSAEMRDMHEHWPIGCSWGSTSLLAGNSVVVVGAAGGGKGLHEKMPYAVQYCMQSSVFGKFTTADAVPPEIRMFLNSAPWPVCVLAFSPEVIPVCLCESEMADFMKQRARSLSYV